MRYIFAYQDFVQTIEELITELQVGDVTVIKVGKNEKEAASNVVSLVAQASGACVLVQVDRKYKSSLASLDVQLNIKKFRREDMVLREWLLPTPPPDEACHSPEKAFTEACSDCAWLVFADNALAAANQIDPLRWAFVAASATTLRKHALGEQLGPMREWGAKYGTPFAPNGGVRFKYKLPHDAETKRTYWHLKDGDKTSAEAAARIYFDNATVGDVKHVIVLYVGPHPEPKDYSVSTEGIAWAKYPPHCAE